MLSVENMLIKQLINFFVGKCGEYQNFFVSLHPKLKKYEYICRKY